MFFHSQYITISNFSYILSVLLTFYGVTPPCPSVAMSMAPKVPNTSPPASPEAEGTAATGAVSAACEGTAGRKERTKLKLYHFFSAAVGHLFTGALELDKSIE